MKYHQELPCFAVIFSLFFINAAYSDQSAKDDDDSKTVFISKQKFTLKCNGTGADTVVWEKDGKNLTDNGKTVKMHRDSKTKEFVLAREGAKDKEVGTYNCTTLRKDGKQVNSQTFNVGMKVFVKVEHDNINVAEGDPLKIVCQTLGSPKISWYYENSTFNETYYTSKDRIILSPGGENNVENAVLQINETQLFDRGEFTCIGQSSVDDKEFKSKCILRVKDRYAALWPFLGICAEVFVLCLIIFIYEKKRNKTELEESDTDQSPDQKNTPDHGKESNLRHRQ